MILGSSTVFHDYSGSSPITMLLRAGSDMPWLDQLEQDQPFNPFFSPYGGPDYQILQNYLKKIRMSGPSPGLGTWATYEKAHRARLTKTFGRLSAEINCRVSATAA